jgi:hypothetical protein
VSAIATGETTESLDAGLIDMARVIAEKFEASAEANLREAEYRDRESEQYAHLPAYANWSREYAEIFRRESREDQEVAERNRRYMARGAVASGGSAG